MALPSDADVAQAEGWDWVDEAEVADAQAAQVGAIVPRGSRPPPSVSRAHWQPAATASACTTPACASSFSLGKRKCWCHKCGQIFCRTCVGQQRRLAPDASYDPIGGLPCPVCLPCFLQGSGLLQPLGQIRDHSAAFQAARREKLQQRDAAVRAAATRLVLAFRQAPRAMAALQSAIGLAPEWTKANHTFPHSAAARGCATCGTSFSLLGRPKRCSLCGLDLCARCVFNSVEVFPTPDGGAKVQIYHPELTKHKAIVLPGCDACLLDLERACALDKRLKLLRHSSASGAEPPASEGARSRGARDPTSLGKPASPATSVSFDQPSAPFVALVELYNTRLFRVKTEARQGVQAYQSLALSLRSEQRRHSTRGQDVVRALAKHQTDLADLFSDLQLTTENVAGKLKRVRAKLRPTEVRCLDNLVRAHREFYAQHIGAFRALCGDVGQLLPPEVLSTIQAVMDAKALCFAYVGLKQCAIELTAFGAALDELVGQIIACLETVEREWRTAKVVEEPGADLDSELLLLDQLVLSHGREQPMFLRHVGHGNWREEALGIWDACLRGCSNVVHEKGSSKATHASREHLQRLWKLGCQVLGAQVDSPSSPGAEGGDWVLV